MKAAKRILFGVVLFVLVGCVNIIRSNTDNVSYESTLNSPNIGYIDYQSSNLLNSRISVGVTYTGNKGPYDIKQIYISNVQSKNDSLRIYVPSVKGASFEAIDLNVDYGTIRLFNGSLVAESAIHKQLVKGMPTELNENGKKIIITSEITDSGTYSASILRRIKN